MANNKQETREVDDVAKSGNVEMEQMPFLESLFNGLTMILA